MEKQESTQQSLDLASVSGPLLLLMRRLERAELIFDRMVEKGLLSDSDVGLANMKSTLNHAERILRIRARTNRDSSDVQKAVEEIRREVDNLETDLKQAV